MALSASGSAGRKDTKVSVDDSETWVEQKRFTVGAERKHFASSAPKLRAFETRSPLSFSQVYKVTVRTPARSWFVFRRYSEFHDMNEKVERARLRFFCEKRKHFFAPAEKTVSRSPTQVAVEAHFRQQFRSLYV